MSIERTDKGYRGDASQFFIAGELCRRGYVAVVTMGNCPNTDILVSNHRASRFLHIQVKTFLPGSKTCAVTTKAETEYGKTFLWILGGIPPADSATPFDFEYYIIPAADMAKNIRECHEIWSRTPGKGGRAHNGDTKFRTVHLPPYKHLNGWSIEPYRNRWETIAEMLRDVSETCSLP